MRIVICGMGYVGATTGACLLADGQTIVGIDPAEHKVAELRAGRSPVSERGVEAVPLSFSAGLAGFPHEGADLSRLLRRADNRLQQAKLQGRNRVIARDG